MLQSQPMNIKQTLFISDLHLDPHQAHITALFDHFIENIAPRAERIYVLGDLFEMWIGDDDESEFHTHIISQFRSLTDRNIALYFMRGNRDFFLGERFAKACGGTLLPDPSVISLYGKTVVICHGDSLCTDDIAHQRLRKVTLSKPFHAIALSAPLWVRRWVGRKMRSQSKQRQQQLDPILSDVNEDSAHTLLKQHQSQLLIHGHTHRPAIHQYEAYQRIVLGSWHHQGSVCCIPESGKPALNAFEI